MRSVDNWQLVSPPLSSPCHDLARRYEEKGLPLKDCSFRFGSIITSSPPPSSPPPSPPPSPPRPSPPPQPSPQSSTQSLPPSPPPSPSSSSTQPSLIVLTFRSDALATVHQVSADFRSSELSEDETPPCGVKASATAAATKLVAATIGSDKTSLQAALLEASSAGVSQDLLLAGVKKMSLINQPAASAASAASASSSAAIDDLLADLPPIKVELSKLGGMRIASVTLKRCRISVIGSSVVFTRLCACRAESHLRVGLPLRSDVSDGAGGGGDSVPSPAAAPAQLPEESPPAVERRPSHTESGMISSWRAIIPADLLQALKDLNLRNEAPAIEAASVWCADNEPSCLADIQGEPELISDFLTALSLPKIPEKKLRAVLEAEVVVVSNREAKYESIRLIGKGGFGKTYLVRDRHSDQRFASKQLSELTKTEADEALGEFHVMQQLRHQMLVEAIEAFCEPAANGGEFTVRIAFETRSFSMTVL